MCKKRFNVCHRKSQIIFMKNHKLVPSRCFWCENGRIIGKKCSECGATYGTDRKTARKRESEFILPSVKDFRKPTFKDLIRGS